MPKKKTITPQDIIRDSANHIPLRITDTTLRDAHQSLWATRMRTSDIMKIIDVVDNVGYYSLEVWGGATFDVCLRFLREDPWDRLRQIKSRAKKTPLQMLLRGQNILGYKNYSDDVVDRFIALAIENGVDIFRIFDALNDTRNLEQAIKCVKKYGGHAQGTISYTVSPVHTVDLYVKVAQEQIAMGIDSLCIKDMAGILSPIAAERLVSALVRETKIPIQVHSHATSGMASSTYVEAVRAGAGAIDCAISPMAGFSSQPPVETMLAIFAETHYNANLDQDALRQVCKFFIDLAPTRQLKAHQADNIIDPEVLLHHIPGGMISNLRGQLAQQGALDKLDQVFDELPRVRADLGYPPLVTPTSQIIGIQAVMNVLSGERYSLVAQEVKDYAMGLYGRSPAPMDKAVLKKILGGEKPITGRPADRLKPMLPDATEGVDPKMIKKEEDIISYCLFPEVSLDYFKWRALPPDQRAAIPADVELAKQVASEKTQTAPAMAPAIPFLAASDYQSIHELVDKISALNFSQITIQHGGSVISINASGVSAGVQTSPAVASTPPPVVTTTPSSSAAPAATQVAPVAKPAAAPAPTGPSVNAPLNGTFYRSPGPGKPEFVQEGDVVEEGATVCIVEAMKLFNPIKAPYKCKIVSLLIAHGTPVKKDDPMISIQKL
ncbi:MAG: pyruvate carboxylase subunit B [bacterium]